MSALVLARYGCLCPGILLMDDIGRLSLRANFMWTSTGNVVHAACQWGVLVALAKLGTPRTVGQFGLGLAVTTPIFLLANLHLRVVLATDTRKEFQLGEYLTLRCVTSLLAMFAIVVVLVVVEFPLQTEIVILFVGVAKMFWAVGELFYGFFQQYERMDFVSKSLSLKGFLCVLCLTAGMTLAGSVIWGAAGYAAAYVVVLFAYDIPKTLDLLRLASAIEQFPVYAINGLRQLFPSRLILRNIGRLTWLAAPAGLTLALFSLADNIPRYFIERHMGERELGLFAALSYFVLAGYMFMSALGQSAVPKLARYYATGESLAFRRLVLKVISIGIAVGLLGVLGARFVGRQLLVLVYNPEYAEHGTLLFWLMVAGVMLYVGGALGVAFTATRAFKKMPLPYFAIAIVSFVLSATLIPAYGLVGAAWVLLGVYALLCVVMILLLKSTPLPS